LLSFTNGPLLLFYTCLLLMGTARAFQSSALGALTAQVVPPTHFTNAATWDSSACQSTSIVGPALGGFLIALQRSPALIFAINAGVLLVLGLLLGLIRPRAVARFEEQATLGSLFAGLRFIWDTKVILAAITLDMFAVLLGGATALLPI